MWYRNKRENPEDGDQSWGNKEGLSKGQKTMGTERKDECGVNFSAAKVEIRKRNKI